MRQEQMLRRKYRTPRRHDRNHVLALDPRDPDVVRVKTQMSATANRSTAAVEAGSASSGKRKDETQLLTYELQQRRGGRWVTIGLRPVNTGNARVVAEWVDGRSRLIEWI